MSGQGRALVCPGGERARSRGCGAAFLVPFLSHPVCLGTLLGGVGALNTLQGLAAPSSPAVGVPTGSWPLKCSLG